MVGRKLVEAALEAGDHVVATARKPEGLHDLVDPYGDRVRTVQHDIRDALAYKPSTGRIGSKAAKLNHRLRTFPPQAHLHLAPLNAEDSVQEPR